MNVESSVHNFSCTHPFALRSSVFDDCSCVLMTSKGFVIHDETVPATPPDRNLLAEKRKTVASVSASVSASESHHTNQF